MADNRKKNCWEIKNCGRQPGGARVRELGVCPAAIESRVDGDNGGKNGGRVCWVIAGTLCQNRVQGSFAAKLADCMKCEFYRSVMAEEGADFVKSRDVLAKLK